MAVKQTIVIPNKLGLHARAASKLVSLAAKFESESKLKVLSNQVSANCKSIMGLMMLAASCGTEIEISAIGRDEKEALSAIIQLISQRFGESE